MATKSTTNHRTVDVDKRPATTTELPERDLEALAQAAECLRILAHPIRLRFVQMLLRGRFAVGELANDCEIPQNVASEHLRLLQRCGLLDSRREGRRVYYRVAEEHLERLMACIEARFSPSPES